MNSVEVFGLLHLAENELSAVNVKVHGFSEQIKIYLSNASLLDKSLAAQGLNFTLLTNNKSKLIENLDESTKNLNIVQIDCLTSVPSGVPFYSAHFKVDAFRFIGSLNLDYAIFCDLDVVCLKPIPEIAKNLREQNVASVYDISDQIIPELGHELIIKNLETITGVKSEGRWIGGEFLCGSSAFFSKITLQIEKVLPFYFEKLKNRSIELFGDEVYTTVAIENLRRENLYVSEAGNLNFIWRFWSSGTKFSQKSFRHSENVFLLHLPADKYFLQQMNKKFISFNTERFLAEYRKMIRFQKIKNIPREIIYLLFRIKAKTLGLRKIKFKK